MFYLGEANNVVSSLQLFHFLHLYMVEKKSKKIKFKSTIRKEMLPQ